MEIEAIVKTYWLSLCNKLNIFDVDKVEAVWNIICSHYNEPHRYYHTLTHIFDMLRLAEHYQNLIHDINSVTLAIFFHDIIYDTHSNQNEEMSALLFNDSMKDVVDSALIDKITKYIICTKLHNVLQENDEDLILFIDLDLLILGAERNEYFKYSCSIRKEYIHYPINDYCCGRLKVLRHFLETYKYIYATDTIRSLKEISARDNINWECELLEKGIPFE